MNNGQKLTIKKNVLHPSVGLVYVIALLSLTMFTTNPIIRLLSLCGAGLTYALFQKKEKRQEQLRYTFFIVVISAFSNFIFINAGSTKLWQVSFQVFSRWVRLAWTVEAFFYGLSFGLALASLFLWFQCLDTLLPAENLIYLFARPLPKLALVLKLILNFIPIFIKRLEALKDAQATLVNSKDMKWRKRLDFNQQLYVALFSWSLRDALITSDSMNSRGYGLGERSNYAWHRFKKSDCMLIFLILCLSFLIVWQNHQGTFTFYYYPRLRLNNQSMTDFYVYTPVVLLFFLPVCLYGKEFLKWHYLKWKM